MAEVRIGIIGIGNMGSSHARQIVQGKVPGGVLAAVCDTDPARLAWAAKEFGDEVQRFDNAQAFFDAKVVDGVIVATPHYDHPPLSIEGLQRGLHVLCEKPVGVYTQAAEELNAVAATSDRKFTMMFNQRTVPAHQKIKELIESGELGAMRRANWIITDWYRTEFYYRSGGWRATWAGEGGGVLLNQCPHQLDLWQWICGLPKRVRAFCHFGKFHDIEVEDDVTAYMEYDNGATGCFITTTGEAPGTNRFEYVGTKGKLIFEDGKLTFHRNRVPVDQHLLEATTGFGKPECWTCDIPIHGEATNHAGIMSDWVQAIQGEKELFVQGVEGINGLSLGNAMLMSAWTDGWVDLPVDGARFRELLEERVKTSTYKKPEVVAHVQNDMSGTF